MQGRSVLDEAIAGSGRVGDPHHELEALQREMSDPDKADDMDRILDRFGHVQEEYEHLGGYALESQAREVLHGLGFKDDQIDGGGTMIFVSHDRMFLRGLGSRVLELGGESGTDRHPTVYPGSYVEYVQKLGHEAPGIYS
jgi:ATPase subunit of ABC transporter with duplicated ATPase domains